MGIWAMHITYMRYMYFNLTLNVIRGSLGDSLRTQIWDIFWPCNVERYFGVIRILVPKWHVKYEAYLLLASTINRVRSNLFFAVWNKKAFRNSHVKITMYEEVLECNETQLTPHFCVVKSQNAAKKNRRFYKNDVHSVNTDYFITAESCISW